MHMAGKVQSIYAGRQSAVDLCDMYVEDRTSV
jgi:hypothetical protein